MRLTWWMETFTCGWREFPAPAVSPPSLTPAATASGAQACCSRKIRHRKCLKRSTTCLFENISQKRQRRQIPKPAKGLQWQLKAPLDQWCSDLHVPATLWEHQHLILYSNRQYCIFIQSGSGSRIFVNPDPDSDPKFSWQNIQNFRGNFRYKIAVYFLDLHEGHNGSLQPSKTQKGIYPALQIVKFILIPWIQIQS